MTEVWSSRSDSLVTPRVSGTVTVAAAAVALTRDLLELVLAPAASAGSLPSCTPASVSSRMIERASVGDIRACSKAARSSARDRKPWPRPRLISSSRWVMVASSSCLRDTAAALLGMRHLPSWAHLALAHAPLTVVLGRTLKSLWAGLLALGSY